MKLLIVKCPFHILNSFGIYKHVKCSSLSTVQHWEATKMIILIKMYQGKLKMRILKEEFGSAVLQAKQMHK